MFRLFSDYEKWQRPRLHFRDAPETEEPVMNIQNSNPWKCALPRKRRVCARRRYCFRVDVFGIMSKRKLYRSRLHME
jgi:hypothetical protein